MDDFLDGMTYWNWYLSITREIDFYVMNIKVVFNSTK